MSNTILNTVYYEKEKKNKEQYYRYMKSLLNDTFYCFAFF